MVSAPGATDYTPMLVMANAAIVGAVLVVAGRRLAAGRLTSGVPDAKQNVGEFVVGFFLGKAREMSHGLDRAKVVRWVAPLLGSFFLFIFLSNLWAMLPLPKLNTPPTSYFSGTLALALCSVGSTLTLSFLFKGAGGAIKHLFWPNPMQWVSEITDVLSLSLRLFGNIGGEYMTVSLVLLYAPYGIPLVLHALGLIPAFVQALVFTLLTSSFMASAIHKEERKPTAGRKKWFARGKAGEAPVEPATGTPAVAADSVVAAH
jgi:F-type H+-transporting ATPase subunit a